MLARLVVSEPYRPTRRVVVRETPFVIGRDAGCQLVLDNPSVSKRHAALHLRDDCFYIEDCGSKNGTLVNGVAPATGDPLRNRDLITVGGLDLLFQEIRLEDLDAGWGADLEKLRTALDLTSKIRAASLLDSALDQVMSGLMRLTQADRGFLLLRDDRGELRMVRSVNITDQQFRQKESALSRSAVDRAVEQAAPVVISNASDDSYFGDRQSVVALSLKTLVCVPVMLEPGRVIGLLYADSGSREQGFTELDVEVLRSLADGAAIALENERLQAEIRKVLDEASAVLSRVESADLDVSLQRSLRRTLNAMRELNLVSGSKDRLEAPQSGLVHEG